jgi:hypothetical protein
MDATGGARRGVSDVFPCRVCGKTWTGHSRCHCATCHENFNSDSGFDRHRKDFVCLAPATRGLVLVDGYWQMPGRRPVLPSHDAQEALELAA